MTLTVLEEVKELERLNPLWSTYICLATVIKGKKLDRESIKRYFKFVPREEYISADREYIIEHLYKLSNKS